MNKTLALLGAAILFATSAMAGIIQIPANQPTIQAGIDAATQGDTVLVADGTYYENINFKGKAITVASHFLTDGDTTHINNTIIDGSKPTDPDKGSVVSFVSGEDTTSVICGFTITGGRGTVAEADRRVGGGIYCNNSGARIIHNKIVFNVVNYTKDCAGGGIGYWRQTNSSARYVIIEDNVIESNSLSSANTAEGYLDGGGIHIVKGRVTGNTIRFNRVGGQPLFSGGGGISATCEDDANRTLVVITRNTITHNKVYAPGYGDYGGGWGGGVDVVFCNVQIINNTISHNETEGNNSVGAGIRLWRSQEISVIKNNIISFNSAIMPGWAGGIELWQTKGVQVVGNRIEGNNSSLVAGGIDETNCSGNLIKGNFIKGNIGGEQGGGIWAMNAKIINNVIVENEARRGGGIFYLYHPSFPSNLAQIINNTITKNVADTAGGIAIYKANAVVMNTICWGNTASHGPEIEMWGGTLNAAYSDIQFGAEGIVIDSAATINWLAGNIVTDPAFADADYRLSDKSYCLGAGTQSMNIDGQIHTAPDTDNEGNTRPSPALSNPDMGAYESPLDRPGGLRQVPETYARIQAAIDAAVDGDVVLVKDSTYYENINFKGKAITVASHFLMDDDTTHINNTVINGSQAANPDSGSVVYFISGEDTTSVLQGFTITGGTGTETIAYEVTTCRGGGGILCFNAGARILNNKITGNTVFSPDKIVVGGGLAALPGGSAAYVIIQDNQMMHNTLTANAAFVGGGGAVLWFNGKLIRNQISYNSVVQNAADKQACSGGMDCECLNAIMEQNKITHNSIVSYSDKEANTAFGGGCLIQGCTGRFSKNEVSQNEIWIKTEKNAVGGGMELISVAESFIIEGNIISDNAITNGRGWGGGIGFYDCSPYTANNIISGNSVTTGGGGLYITLNVKVQLINNTIVDNNASEYGGGIIVRNSSANPVLMNSIIWNNQSPTGAGIHIEEGIVQATYCDIQGGWGGTGNINADPQFVPGDTLYHLSSASLCINAGIDSLLMGGIMIKCPSDDYDADDGFQRPYPGTLPDIGADETDVVTGVDRWLAVNIPQEYALQQNYPNPFNPSTTIEFALPKLSLVTLKVYNLLGEEVATLVAEKRAAGIHRLNWDASGLASGVYLYRLEAGEFVQVKKLILMR